MGDIFMRIGMIAIGALFFGFMFYSLYLMLFSKHQSTTEQASGDDGNPSTKKNKKS